MGRRDGDSRGAMITGARSELVFRQDSPQRLGGRSECGPDADMDAAGRPAMEVKKHQHKHNLKHRYELMETLGKGTYGKVKKAVDRASQKTVAIKTIRKDRITEDIDRIHIQREIEITSSLMHSHIIRFLEVFESHDKIVIVMEYASRGELYDYILEKRKLSETEARSIFRQITSAVHYCHKNGVVHRDLKLENILLDQDFNVKLADFGLSNQYQRGTLLQTFCGSPLYAAPEIVTGLPYEGPEVDCWALGVLLYALVYSSMPFDGASHSKLKEQICQGRYRRPNLPSDACALIDWLLTVRVDERATIEDVANHWWVNWGYEESVCDCTPTAHPDCPSPLLARYIDWQNRVVSSLASEPGCLAVESNRQPLNRHYFSLPHRAERGGRVRGGMSTVRKSPKENTIAQTTQGACGGSAFACAALSLTSTSERKKPKSILKHQRSFESVLHSSSKDSRPPCTVDPQLYQTHALGEVLSANLQSPYTFTQPSSKMPKKGILKNMYEGESVVISSVGRESRESDARDARLKKQHTLVPATDDSPTMHPGAVRRRKGILKRNGKFSRSLDLPDEQSLPPPSDQTFPDTLQQFLQAKMGIDDHHSRPSSVMSEDSLFSSDSFDLLDLSTQSQRSFFPHGVQHSACSSEEDLRGETCQSEGCEASW
ncbi:NUAK family SNF1-like kinase 1 [Corythoichthys intestinalis]|uniref:NUAK family SNF1-like kinase 1 n=1 Tax=Corythoichthys intestinalis TaxID=161448 RepID=UPI0025A6308E|nr:NUAK family SNF1-like kinase 1 [Corythoichthys intestinalis]XP_061802096.1 NUAK family SNF1-like kinase 1 [Nerophis lumbriciformis]